MWSFGKKLWDIIRSVLSAKRGCPSVTITVPIPANVMTAKPASRWKYVVIHHSYSSDDHTTRNWDAIRKYHVQTNRWKDIGYHYGIERVNGSLEVLYGRPLSKDGAHAIGFNRNGIGICMVGNYNLEPPSEDRLYMLESLVRNLMKDHGIAAHNVIGHRETYFLRGVKQEKTCPGALFCMDTFRSRLPV